ncbi:MAG: hypothetical protein FJW32_00170 [Acidobacteria bacterium]|nr:hypothetical protein [Acidobacteriota bacterium]
MSLLGNALLAVALAGGAGLSALIGAVIVEKPGKRAAHWWALALFVAAFCWHGAALYGFLQTAALDGRSFDTSVPFRVMIALFCVVAAPERPWRFVFLLLAGVPFDPPRWAGFGTFAALFALGGWIQFRGWLGLYFSRRIRLVGALAVISTIYLLAVRRLSDFLSREFDAFGELLEVALIFAGALGWLALYGWMTRAMSRRTALYTAFGRRVIEEAVPILDLRERVQFLAEGVAKTFSLHRCKIRIEGPPVAQGAAGASSGESWSHEFALRYEDQIRGTLWADCHPRASLEEDAAVLEDLCRQIAHSIEACRLAEEKLSLERTLVEQEQLATMGTLAATIAHEVKNPLGPMKTLAQLMAEDPELPPRCHKDLEIMLSEIDRLNRCVEQLLGFARPLRNADGEIDVAALVDTAMRLMAREAAPRRVELRHTCAPGLKLRGKDRQGVQQILLNLVLNAVQASTEGGIVVLDVTANGDGLRLRVTDDGPGIPGEMQRRVFDPFFTTKQQGTGLGLAIVSKNVKQLGGALRLESPVADGRGTRVVVELGAEAR